MVGVITSTDMPGSMRTPFVVRKCLVVMRYFAIFGCFVSFMLFFLNGAATHIYIIRSGLMWMCCRGGSL